jgi:hypothetical protein
MKCKKTFTTLIAVILLCMPFLSANAADTTTTGSDNLTAPIAVEGDVSSTTLSITHPISVAYTADVVYSAAATGKEIVTFTNSSLSITNNTPAQVTLTIESFKSSPGGSVQLTDVASTYYSDWYNISSVDADKYIALGIKAAGASGFATYNNRNIQWGISTDEHYIGVMNTNATVGLALTGYVGPTHATNFTAQHNLILRFDLT